MKLLIASILVAISYAQTGCAERTANAWCHLIQDREACLTSRESRRGMLRGAQIWNSPCVWCHNGPCNSHESQQCEPQAWMDSFENSEYEVCLHADGVVILTSTINSSTTAQSPTTTTQISDVESESNPEGSDSETQLIVAQFAFYVPFAAILLIAWCHTFFHALCVEKTNQRVKWSGLVTTGMSLFFILIESIDPLAHWDIFDGTDLRFFYSISLTFLASWLLLTGLSYSSSLLFAVGARSKSELDYGHRFFEMQCDSQLKRIIGMLWFFICLALSCFWWFEMQTEFDFTISTYTVCLFVGLLIGLGMIALALYAADHKTDLNTNQRKGRKIFSHSLYWILVHLLVFIIALLVDICLGVPTEDTVQGSLAASLIMYGLVSRLSIAFEIWFNWHRSRQYYLEYVTSHDYDLIEDEEFMTWLQSTPLYNICNAGLSLMTIIDIFSDWNFLISTFIREGLKWYVVCLLLVLWNCSRMFLTVAFLSGGEQFWRNFVKDWNFCNVGDKWTECCLDVFIVTNHKFELVRVSNLLSYYWPGVGFYHILTDDEVGNDCLRVLWWFLNVWVLGLFLHPIWVFFISINQAKSYFCDFKQVPSAALVSFMELFESLPQLALQGFIFFVVEGRTLYLEEMETWDYHQQSYAFSLPISAITTFLAVRSYMKNKEMIMRGFARKDMGPTAMINQYIGNGKPKLAEKKLEETIKNGDFNSLVDTSPDFRTINTVLMMSAANGHYNIVAKLCQKFQEMDDKPTCWDKARHGCENAEDAVNKTDSEGNTALSGAIVAAFLLKYDKKIYMKGNNGIVVATKKDFFEDQRLRNYDAIIERLIRAKAKMDGRIPKLKDLPKDFRNRCEGHTLHDALDNYQKFKAKRLPTPYEDGGANIESEFRE